MKKDKYEDAAERLLIKNEKEAFKEIVQTTQDALSTTDFRKYYDNNLVS